MPEPAASPPDASHVPYGLNTALFNVGHRSPCVKAAGHPARRGCRFWVGWRPQHPMCTGAPRPGELWWDVSQFSPLRPWFPRVNLDDARGLVTLTVVQGTGAFC